MNGYILRVIKRRNLIFLGFTFALLSVSILDNIYNYFSLNQISLNALSIMTLDKQNEEKYSLSNESTVQKPICHIQWLYTIYDYHTYFDKNKLAYIDILNCSQIHVNMVHAYFPHDPEIANAANQIYPKNRDVLYWRLDSQENDLVNSKLIISELLELDQNDSLAWRRLGSIYLENGEREKAVASFIKSCMIGDNESNGCYYIGNYYKGIHEYEKAIYYLRLSYWHSTQVHADLLEAKLASGEIQP